MFGGRGGTAMTQIIVGLTDQVVGGFIWMYWTQRSEGPCLGGGGYRNDANYCGINRPGCWGGLVRMYWTQWIEGPCLRGGWVPQ